MDEIPPKTNISRVHVSEQKHAKYFDLKQREQKKHHKTTQKYALLCLKLHNEKRIQYFSEKG